MSPPRLDAPAEERLWASVERRGEAECWPWTGTTNACGYGQLTRDGRTVRTHRLAWEITNGPIPAGLCVCHSCDNPPCCNPSHLWLGTHAENMKDKVRKGRSKFAWRPRKTHCCRGHELTPENCRPLKNGGRRCRICQDAAWRERAKRIKNTWCVVISLPMVIWAVYLAASEPLFGRYGYAARAVALRAEPVPVSSASPLPSLSQGER